MREEERKSGIGSVKERRDRGVIYERGTFMIWGGGVELIRNRIIELNVMWVKGREKGKKDKKERELK